MDIDFRVGPLLWTFNVVKKSPSARTVVNIAPGKGPILKSISFEDLAIVLNFCSDFNH